MGIKQKPFIRTKLEKEDCIKVRLNKQERKELEDLKQLIDIDRDGTAIKLALLWALEDIRNKSKGRYRIKIIRKKVTHTE